MLGDTCATTVASLYFADANLRETDRESEEWLEGHQPREVKKERKKKATSRRGATKKQDSSRADVLTFCSAWPSHPPCLCAVRECTFFVPRELPSLF